MKIITNILLFLTGFLGLLIQVFGILIICILLAYITKYYITITICYLILEALGIWKNWYFKKQGKKPHLGQYK